MNRMKLLIAAPIFSLLVACTAGQQQALTVLTDQAKAACAQQAAFNVIASGAAGFGPEAAAAAAIASAAVGIGCTWVNAR